MGGQGPGHKSVRAIEARLKNIQKARAARKRVPLPWRSGMESRMIEQLVWQWFLEARGWRLEAGKSRGKSEMQIPRRYAPRNDNVYGGADKPWAKVRVARFLGVSHTWVNKLVKKFEADPDRMRRKMAAFAPASIEKLERAREETRWERERGRLRDPIRYRRVKVTIQGKKTRVVAATGAERGRRQAEVESERARLRGEKNEQQVPHRHPATFTRGPLATAPAGWVRDDSAFLAYREVPEWAKGLLLPGDPGTSSGKTSGPGASALAMDRSGATRTPRPVPFAFRRRR